MSDIIGPIMVMTGITVILLALSGAFS